MGKLRQRYVAKAFESRWRVWNRKTKRWWGNSFPEYPQKLLDELNGAKRPDQIIRLSNLYSGHNK